VAEDGKGNSGGIYISADSLSLTKNTELNAGTWGVGNSGEVILKASDSISLIDSQVQNRVNKNAVGNSGGIDITTGNLSINKSGLTATTEGTGNAGPVIINASGSISMNGGYVSSRVAEKGVGNSGGLYITADSLSLTNKAELNASTWGVGNSGSVIIKASDRISLRDGSFISSRVTDSGKGNSSGIYITADSLSLTNNAELNVSSFGQGNPGNLVITADSIRLENQGKLTAQTLSGEGGNIVLQVEDILLLRDNSLISAQASGDAKGGNINIDAGFIIAFPNQNNDIIASAQRGNGGNINITTQAIFGLEERSSTPHNTTNDIDASSEFGLNGNVSINTPDVDPSRGLVNLPVEPVNVEVTEGCQGDGKQASVEFFNTGRGGLAPNPYEPLSSSNIWEDVPHPTQRTENSASAAKASASPATPSNKIVEAQGWHINDKGEVVLVAQMPATRSQNRCRLR
jgi:large exoprotein involved in heme utilization and adhesion